MSELVQLPLAIVLSLKTWISRLSDSSTPLLPYIPKPIKLLVLLLIALNSPSLPSLWHLRVWYYPLRAYWLVYRQGRRKYLENWQKENTAGGGVKIVTKLKRVAWVDDCDYNLHLSNSSYAKSLDASRMQWCIDGLAPVFTPKCHMAMGASHYVFYKEIPAGSEYVMESRLGGWGEKWMYLITEFVIYPKKSPAAQGKAKAVIKDVTPNTLAVPTISTVSGSTTPVNASGSSTPPSSAEEVKKSAAVYRARNPRNDGGVVCCLAVSEYCFKMGRVTVPPRIALHFCLHSPSKAQHDKVRDLIFKTKDKGVKWLKGGWKEDPEADKLGKDIGVDAVSEQREGGAEWVEQGREGMEKVVSGLGAF